MELRSPVILFLDFDGVLHPTDAVMDGLFCHLSRLEEVLREFPSVEIVISSTWRESHPIDELRQRFSPDIARRIVGQTPVRPDPVGLAPEVASFVREGECMAWIQGQGCERPWLAVDDDVRLFRPRSSVLHWVDGSTGLTEEAAEALRLRLKSILASA